MESAAVEAAAALVLVMGVVAGRMLVLRHG
jgi:hypothetical protein